MWPQSRAKVGGPAELPLVPPREELQEAGTGVGASEASPLRNGQRDSLAGSTWQAGRGGGSSPTPSPGAPHLVTDLRTALETRPTLCAGAASQGDSRVRPGNCVPQRCHRVGPSAGACPQPEGEATGCALQLRPGLQARAARDGPKHELCDTAAWVQQMCLRKWKESARIKGG